MLPVDQKPNLILIEEWQKWGIALKVILYYFFTIKNLVNYGLIFKFSKNKLTRLIEVY
jgi:hypothetical protein